MCRKYGNLFQNLGYDGFLFHPVPVNTVRDITDHLTVAQCLLSFRHADQYKVQLIRKINQLPVHLRQIYPHIEKD